MINSAPWSLTLVARWSLTLVRKIFVELLGAVVSTLRVI